MTAGPPPLGRLDNAGDREAALRARPPVSICGPERPGRCECANLRYALG